MASDHGFLLVYPVGLNAMWAAIDVDPDALDDNRDVRFFDAVLEQLATQFSIDRTRIYLTGMSNGASFAQLRLMPGLPTLPLLLPVPVRDLVPCMTLNDPSPFS